MSDRKAGRNGQASTKAAEATPGGVADGRAPAAPRARVRMPHFASSAHSTTDAEQDALWAAVHRGDAVVLDALMATLQFETEADCAAYMAQLASLPRRALPVIVAELPAWLADMGPDDPVRVFDGRHDRLERAGTLQVSLRENMARQAAGHLWPVEVAHALAPAIGAGVEAVESELRGAFDRRELKFWKDGKHWTDGPLVMPMDPEEESQKGGNHVLSYGGCYTTPQAVDAWLDLTGPWRRLPRFPDGPWSRRPGAASPMLEESLRDETKDERQRRRYGMLIAGGGKLRREVGGWRIAGTRGCLVRLAKAEQAAGRKFSDPRDVSDDVKAEAERRRSGRALPSA